jgi:hypothetical protein
MQDRFRRTCPERRCDAQKIGGEYGGSCTQALPSIGDPDHSGYTMARDADEERQRNRPHRSAWPRQHGADSADPYRNQSSQSVAVEPPQSTRSAGCITTLSTAFASSKCSMMSTLVRFIGGLYRSGSGHSRSGAPGKSHLRAPPDVSGRPARDPWASAAAGTDNRSSRGIGGKRCEA